MKNLTQEDYNLANILVDEIIDNTELPEIKYKILNQIENFEANKKREFLFHLNGLFGNIIMNELSWRCNEAEIRAHNARLITKELKQNL
jgi:hypothetical protein